MDFIPSSLAAIRKTCVSVWKLYRRTLVPGTLIPKKNGLYYDSGTGLSKRYETEGYESIFIPWVPERPEVRQKEGSIVIEDGFAITRIATGSECLCKKKTRNASGGGVSV